VEAEHAIEAGEATAAPILQKLIGVIAMQEIDVMQKYFSDDAWAEWKHHYEDWPSPEWQALYRDISAVLGADPASTAAQALADRWMALTLGEATVPGVRTGLMKAWADREHWPPALKRRMAEFSIEQATRFVNDALWERWEAERQASVRAGTMATPRVSESRRALFRECTQILGADPSSEGARSVVSRWRALVEEETGGDEETRAAMLKAFRGRKNWPVGMKRYWASTYELDVETWEKVTDFIERAATSLSP
jgi:hypothetical protein